MGKPSKPTKPQAAASAVDGSTAAAPGVGDSGTALPLAEKPPADQGSEKVAAPRGKRVDKSERRYFSVADSLLHDGTLYAAGDEVALIEAEFNALRPTGALQATAWSDGEVAAN